MLSTEPPQLFFHGRLKGQEEQIDPPPMVALISLVVLTIFPREQEGLHSRSLPLPLLGQASPRWVRL